MYWLFLSFGVTKYLAEATSKGFSCLGSQFHHKEAMAEFMVGTTAEQTREQEAGRAVQPASFSPSFLSVQD